VSPAWRRAQRGAASPLAIIPSGANVRQVSAK
jgi:hypothetical protein